MTPYPPALAEIVAFFGGLTDAEKRENLELYAEQAPLFEPREGEAFDVSDIRKDAACLDTVGIFLRVEDGKVRFRARLGPNVQTLTRAMTAILCRGLEGATVAETLALPTDFVPGLVGGELHRLRSQTVYYILVRMKGACREYEFFH